MIPNVKHSVWGTLSTVRKGMGSRKSPKHVDMGNGWLIARKCFLVAERQ